MLSAFTVLLARWSTRTGWDRGQHLVVAAGALTAIAVIAFTVDPIGHVPSGAKYATNAVLLLLLLAVLATVERRLHRSADCSDHQP